MERIIELAPAYDLSAEGKGVHCVELRMVLKGLKGAVQFVLYTGWFLPNVTEDLRNKYCRRWPTPGLKCAFEPLPADLGYHSPKPLYEEHEPITEACKYLDGKPCYYDGSTLEAARVFQVLLERGSEGLWEELEKEYRKIFGCDENTPRQTGEVQRRTTLRLKWSW